MDRNSYFILEVKQMGLEAEFEILKRAYDALEQPVCPESQEEITIFENEFENIPTDYRWLLQNFGGDYFIEPAEVFGLRRLQELHLDFSRYFEEKRFAISSEEVFPISYTCGDIVCIVKETRKIAVFPYDMVAKTTEDLRIIAENFTELVLAGAKMRIEYKKMIDEVEEMTKQFDPDYKRIFKDVTVENAEPLVMVDDDELGTAIMLQLLEHEEEMENLPMTCQRLNAVFTVVNRAYAQDFDQVYCEMAHLVPLAIEGLLALNEIELADTIKESYAIYEQNKNSGINFSYKDDDWDRLMELELFEDTLEKFNAIYDERNYLKITPAKYIRDNYKDFLNL